MVIFKVSRTIYGLPIKLPTISSMVACYMSLVGPIGMVQLILGSTHEIVGFVSQFLLQLPTAWIITEIAQERKQAFL